MVLACEAKRGYLEDVINLDLHTSRVMSPVSGPVQAGKPSDHYRHVAIQQWKTHNETATIIIRRNIA